MPTSRDDSGRARLERHVQAVQRTVRACAGCGLCCTATYNSVAILPWEARRIAAHLASLAPARRTTLLDRARLAVERFRLARPGRGLRHYTCAFLEPDLTCALPLGVKPAACLSFNPLTPERCDQEPEWFAGAGAEAEAANRAAGLPGRRTPIPLAVLDATGERTTLRPRAAGGAARPRDSGPRA